MLKRVVIFGKDSYIGGNITKYLKSHGYDVLEIDSKQVKPKEIDLNGIDVVINVAGIAHIKITADLEPLFYNVNTGLALELASFAKESGVKQYIYFSSMNVYGDTTCEICSEAQENPANFYGKSKLMADNGLFALENDKFKIASIRPPVVYGYGCKGNFQRLIKIAKITPVFPNFQNRKSMIYIGNLCEFVYQIIENEERGKFHPQDAAVTSTVQTVTEIRRALGKETVLISGFSRLIKFAMKHIHSVQRAFADDFYSPKFSEYKDNSYCIYSFSQSISSSLKAGERECADRLYTDTSRKV